MPEHDLALNKPKPGIKPWRPARGWGWKHLAYFVGVPLIVAIYAALNNWSMIQITGYTASMGFYLAHALLPWWITCLSTLLIMRALSGLKPPWLLLLLLGHMLGSFVVLPYSNWLTGLYEQSWPALQLGAEFAPMFSADFWLYLLRAGAIWFGINFLFDRFVGLPIYRYSIPRGYDNADSGNESAVANASASETPASSWTGLVPGFVDRLPVALSPADILAIKAEQHYIRIITPKKQYMVLYRFSDAIRELDEAMGQQVHRSYWINKSAIAAVHAKAKDFSIRLSNGEEVPVSTPYQGMIREFARTAHIPLRG
jgi:hypothetical protein